MFPSKLQCAIWNMDSKQERDKLINLICQNVNFSQCLKGGHYYVTIHIYGFYVKEKHRKEIEDKASLYNYINLVRYDNSNAGKVSDYYDYFQSLHYGWQVYNMDPEFKHVKTWGGLKSDEKVELQIETQYIRDLINKRVKSTESRIINKVLSDLYNAGY